MRRILKPSGRILVTVPAYGFLWSEHDEALRHHRRYVASELRNKLAVTGFEVQHLTYFITLLFFPILMLRTWNNVFRQSVRPKTSHMLFPAFINSFFIRLLDLERFFLSWMNYPFGVSIVCLAGRARDGAKDAGGPAHR
jgi:tellurite resistance protein TehA-like permease